MEPLHKVVDAALNRERERLGSISPQVSYYERLVALAVLNDDLMRRIHDHVMTVGSFGGL